MIHVYILTYNNIQQDDKSDGFYIIEKVHSLSEFAAAIKSTAHFDCKGWGAEAKANFAFESKV